MTKQRKTKTQIKPKSIPANRSLDLRHTIIYRINQTGWSSASGWDWSGKLNELSELGVDAIWLPDSEPAVVDNVSQRVGKYNLSLINEDTSKSLVELDKVPGVKLRRCLFGGCYPDQQTKLLGAITLMRNAVAILHYGQERDAEDDVEDADSVPNYLRQLISLRKSSLVLQDGVVRPIEDKRRVLAFLRNLGEESVLVVANLSNKAVKPCTRLTGQLLLSSYPEREDAGEQNLRPFEVVIMKV